MHVELASFKLSILAYLSIKGPRGGSLEMLFSCQEWVAYAALAWHDSNTGNPALARIVDLGRETAQRVVDGACHSRVFL